ncbi:MAG: class I SAM-dependent methyltransferase [Leptolyngbyaceae cyanobacterium bins.59]|nr:class I SAM-dependent methyltransferase [Leptolyngbyaceae cyanobacterium bins.59]
MSRYSSKMQEVIEQSIACPCCHSSFEANDSDLLCKNCGFKGLLLDGVFVMGNHIPSSVFDEKYEVMEIANQDEATWRVFYEQQVKLVQPFLTPNSLVLDVGCSSMLPYEHQNPCLVAGLDPSFKSIRANPKADIRVCGSATQLPFADQSVDTIVCFYSVHHMIGNRVSETRQNVACAFEEFGRVIKPGGNLLIFEVSPWLPFWWLQNFLWNRAKRVLGSKLDMYFWSPQAMAALGRKTFPRSVLKKIPCPISPWALFPPVFTLRWLKVPRFLYPLTPHLYHWRF